jgi:uncharacterized protein
MQDKRRVYKSGKGSYDVIEPKLRKLIARHRTRAITARVTLSQGVTDVASSAICGRHWLPRSRVRAGDESGEQAYSLGEEGMVTVLEQFHQLADEWLDYALKGRMHGFSNVSETIGELVQGTNKSTPAGRVWACWASRLRAICRPAIALPMPTATRWATFHRVSTARRRANS